MENPYAENMTVILEQVHMINSFSNEKIVIHRTANIKNIVMGSV
jgi:hypothetical protein